MKYVGEIIKCHAKCINKGFHLCSFIRFIIKHIYLCSVLSTVIGRLEYDYQGLKDMTPLRDPCEQCQSDVGASRREIVVTV